MNTAILHPALQRDADKLIRVCAASFVSAGVILLPAPQLVARVFQLAGASDLGLRAVGVTWLVLGVGAGVVVGRLKPRWFVIAAIVALVVNALFLLSAPFLFGVHVGWFGWIVLFLLTLLSVTGATAWNFIRDRMAATEQRHARRDAVASGAGSVAVVDGKASDTTPADTHLGGVEGSGAEGTGTEGGEVTVSPSVPAKVPAEARVTEAVETPAEIDPAAADEQPRKTTA